MPSRSLEVDRYLVASAVVLTCVLFLPAALDPVNVVKLTVLLLVVIALAASGAARVLRDRVLHVPVGPAGWAVLALLVGFIVSTLVAPVTTTAVVGTYGRNSGLLAYLSAVVLFLVGLRVFDRSGAGVLMGGVVVAALFTGTYGLLQKAGLDAIPWNNPFNPIIAALGNPNFASGYLGIGASVAVGGALWRGWSIGWRACSGVTAALCLLAAALSASVQGPIAAAAGLAVVALAWILEQHGPRRRSGLLALGSVAAVSLVTLIAGAVAKAGPAAPVFTDNGSQARTYYWGAAIEMLGDAPLLGVGLDQYGNFWRTARSSDSVAFLGGPSYSDAAHSVPLQMLAQGGLLLGLAYGAFLVLVAVALVRGLLRLSGADRLLLGAVGGGWAAYQVQSAVSIDQVPLIVLHFALAAAVVAVAGMSGLREVRLPGALKPKAPHPNDVKARRRAAVAPARRSMNGTDLAVLGVLGVLAVGAFWQAFVPLRANVAAKAGDTWLAQGDGTSALKEYDRALSLVPGQSFYSIKKGQLFEKVQQPERALGSFEQAQRVDPYEVNAIKAAAMHAEQLGRLERARTLFARAIALDPYNDETLVAATTFELRHSGAAAAREVLEQAVVRLPGSASAWATLGDARAVLGAPEEARAAYERALALDPGQPVATAGLQKLAAAAA